MVTIQNKQGITYAVCLFLIMICTIIFLFHDYTVSFLFQDEGSSNKVETGPIRIYYLMPYSDDNSQFAEENGNQKILRLRGVTKILKFIRIDFEQPEKSYYDLKELRINNTIFTAPEIMKMVHVSHLIRPELIDGKILRLHLNIPENPEIYDSASPDVDYYLSLKCKSAVRYFDYNSILFYFKLLCFLGLACGIIYLTAVKKLTIPFLLMIKKIFLSLTNEQVISYAVCLSLIMICGIMFLFHNYTVSFLFQDMENHGEVETGPLRIYYLMPYSDDRSQLAEQDGNLKILKLFGLKKILQYIRIDFDQPKKSFYDLKEMRINNTIFTAPEIMKMVHLSHLIRPELIDGKILRLHLDIPENPENCDSASSDVDYYLSLKCKSAARYLDYNSILFYFKILCFLGLTCLIIYLTVKNIIMRIILFIKPVIPEVLLILVMILFLHLRPSLYRYLDHAALVTLLKSDTYVFYIFVFSFLICRLFRRWYMAVLCGLVILFIQLIYVLDCFAMKQFNTRLNISEIPHWTRNVQGEGEFVYLVIQQSYFTTSVIIVILSIILAGILVRRNASGKTDKLFLFFCSFVIIAFLCFQSYPSDRPPEESSYWNAFSYSYRLTVTKKYSKNYRSRVTPFKLQYSSRKGLGLRRNVILLIVESLSSYQSKFFSTLPFDYLPKFDNAVKNEASAYSKNYLSSSYNTATSIFALLTGFSPTNPDYHEFFKNSKFYHNPLPQMFKKAGYETVYITPCAMLDGISLQINRIRWSRIISHRDPVFDNNPRYVYDSVSDDKLFDEIIHQVNNFCNPGKRKKTTSANFFIYAQTLGIHGPFYDYRSKKYSYLETVKTFDLLFTDFLKKLHSVNFFRQGGILVVTGDHRVMLPISPEEEKTMGFFTPQYVPLVIFGKQPCKIDSENLYSHVDLHYSLQWLMLDKVERHQYQRNIFINDIDKNDRSQFFFSFYQLRSDPSCLLFNTWDDHGRIYLAGDDTKIEGKNLSADEKNKIESFLLWTREHMCPQK